MRLEEQKRKAEELQLLRKKEERDRWWAGAEMFASNPSDGLNVHQKDADAGEDHNDRSKLASRYALDYSKWDEWSPNDPATQAEVH